jgi:hypothetical protein
LHRSGLPAAVVSRRPTRGTTEPRLCLLTKLLPQMKPLKLFQISEVPFKIDFVA